MPFPIFLAHGALGPFDELIFISVIVVFITMMGISWFRGQQVEETPPAPPTEAPVDTDHFPLE
jgi:hypothetical protein